MKCDVCKINYPDDLVNGLNTSEGNKMCCGICALEEGNKVLGFNRTKFTGTIAESMRQKAIEYRKKMETGK